MAVTRMTDQVGRVLGGRYRLLAPVGAGASSWVFLATDVTLGRRVAVKLLHESLHGDEAFLRRFRAEARAAAALNHAHIVAVYDWGDDGGPFLVLEYQASGSLRALLDRGYRLSLSQAVMIGIEAARGLDHAHRRGLVHRDIKPANLLFDEDGTLHVADFGVARALAEAAMTEPSGVMIGSARYAAPEQAQGGLIDGRADVYALGLVLIEAVTGELPFASDTTVGTLMARIDTPVPVPESMGILRPILERVGSVDPAARPDAAAFGQLLFDAAGELPAPAALPLTPAEEGPLELATDPTAHPGATAAAASALAGGIPGADDLPPPGVPGSADREVADGDADHQGGDRARPRRLRRVLLVALIVALLAGGGVAARELLAPRHEVPIVAGMSEGDARRLLTDDLGFDVEVNRLYDDTIPAGTVISSQPDAGATRREGTSISLIVSLGPAPVPVPDLTGATVDELEARLADASLSLGEVTGRYDETVPAGVVLTWSVAGEERPAEAPKGASVDVVASDGPEPRAVPDLAGKTFDEAEAALAELDLKAKKVEVFSDDVEKGLVVETAPAAGERVPKDGTVDVRISKGPDLVTIPDVAGRKLQDAINILEKAGLEVSKVLGSPSRTVLATDPPKGEKVRRGSEVVIIMRGAGE